MSKHEELKAAVGVAKNNLTRAINALGGTLNQHQSFTHTRRIV